MTERLTETGGSQLHMGLPSESRSNRRVQGGVSTSDVITSAHVGGNSDVFASLVQQTTAEYLEERLRWHTVYAYNSETFGPDGTLGRASEEDVLLTRHLYQALDSLNPGLSGEAVDNAIRRIVEVSAAQSTLQTNQEKYDLLRNGVKVTYRNPRGGMETRTLRVFDFDAPKNNHFLAVRELWIKGPLYRRRADLVGFVNGIPLLFVELKNIHATSAAPTTRTSPGTDSSGQ